MECLLELVVETEKVGEACRQAVPIGDLEMVELLTHFDSGRYMMRYALEAPCEKDRLSCIRGLKIEGLPEVEEQHEMKVIAYLAGMRRYTSFRTDSNYSYPLFMVVFMCLLLTATRFHFRRMYTQPDEILWTMHNTYRRMIRVLIQSGVSVKVRSLRHPSPILEAAYVHFFCIVLDLFRFGSSFSIHYAPDMEYLNMIISGAVNPEGYTCDTGDPWRSNTSAQLTRMAFMLSSFPIKLMPMAMLQSLLKLYVQHTPQPADDHPTTLMYQKLLSRITLAETTRYCRLVSRLQPPLGTGPL